MRKKPTYYSKETKLALLREYHESGLSKSAFCRQHGIYDSTLLNAWLHTFEPAEKSVSLPLEPETEESMANKDKESYKAEAAALRARVKALEKALAYSKLETKARDILIDKAEEYFNIAIRKKSGAKQ